MQVLSVSADGTRLFEEVFMFSHRMPSTLSTFITLFTDTGASITASPGHYLWVVQKHICGSGQPIRAQDVKISDCLIEVQGKGGNLTQACVVSKSESLEAGLYNPHTASGFIVVNGISALTFTDTLPASVLVHSISTLPGRLAYLLLKAVGGTALAKAVNEVLLAAYFGLHHDTLTGTWWASVIGKNLESPATA